jgi:hypothetical protein
MKKDKQMAWEKAFKRFMNLIKEIDEKYNSELASQILIKINKGDLK